MKKLAAVVLSILSFHVHAQTGATVSTTTTTIAPGQAATTVTPGQTTTTVIPGQAPVTTVAPGQATTTIVPGQAPVTTVTAAPTATSGAESPLVTWMSKGTSDVVTIQNGSGLPLMIQINVNGPVPTAGGITIKNCGTTTSIKAGGSAICQSSDAENPVSFSSDSPSTPASGTYQVKKQ